MRRLTYLAAAVTGALSLGFAEAARATVTLEFNRDWGSTQQTLSAATAAFSFSDASGDVLVSLVLSNTTGGGTTATLVGIAFDLPDSAAVSLFDANGTAFTKLWTDVSLPPFGTFDQGISTPRNTFVGGNANQGLHTGDTLAPLSFMVATTMNAADFETAFLNGHLAGGDLRAAARFQQVNPGGSDKIFGGVPPPPPPPPPDVPEVPEPSAWLLMISGFFGAGAILRRRRRATA